MRFADHTGMTAESRAGALSKRGIFLTRDDWATLGIDEAIARLKNDKKEESK